MGTGVGEVALADAALLGGEYAGGLGMTGALTGGVADAALLGGEFAGGLGLTGGLAGGIGNAALLGGEYAGGLGSLAPAMQTAITGTAAFNPEITAQAMQAVNAGAMPPAGATFGWNPADLATAGQGAGDIAANTVQAPDWADVFAKGQQQAAAAKELYPATQLADASGNVTKEVLANTITPIDLGATDASLGQAGNANLLAEQVKDAASPGGIGDILKNATQPLQNWWNKQNDLTKYGLGGYGALQAAKYLNKQQGVAAPAPYSGPLSKFTYSPDTYKPYTYKPYAAGGPVEEMSRENAIGANTGYPQADINQGAYATPWQTPVSRNVVSGAGDANVDQMTGMERMAEGGSASSGDSGSVASGDTGIAALGPMMYSPAMMSSSLVDPAAEYAAAQPTMDMSRQNFQNFLARYQNLPITEAKAAPVTYQGLQYTPPGGYSESGSETATPPLDGVSYAAAGGLMASGGISSLGGYSDGGRLLRGPGDGMSDNIPANISGRQPARLADGEFVVPADVVSGLGNGSTEAGAKQLYKMLDKVRAARTGTKKQGKQIKAQKYMPA